MDVCLGLGVGETMLTLLQSRASAHRSQQLEKSRGSNFSWSFVSRSAPLPASRLEMDDASGSDNLSDTNSVSGVSDSSFDDSSSNEWSSTSSSLSSYSKLSFWGSRNRAGRIRRPALLEKTPLGRSAGYLTVLVGTRPEASVKFAIRKKLLKHPLFQVLLKCSEDEFGEEFRLKKGFAVACDPALFLEVVKAVDEELWSAQP